jgi:DNA-nicking Smr family endonuclease
MNSDEARKFALLLRTDFVELDLHGLYPEEALGQLDVFLYDMFRAKKECLKVIYGIGSGTLKKSVLSYIGNHPLITDWIDQGGYCLARLDTHDLLT